MSEFETPQEFVDAWVDTFTTDYSYNNPTYARAVLHVIMGRILLNQRIIKRGSETAPRISMFYLQGPSSGKSSAYPMIYEVMNELGIEIMSPDELSDAALIGTIEQEVDEEGNTTWTDSEGILADTEVFHFDEASILINPKKYQQNMMTYLQKALNPIGSEQNKITKQLAHGNEITVRPNCSLLLTSYMPEGIEDTVLNTGFLQRMIVVPRELTIEDRLDQVQQDIQALGQDAKETSLEMLVSELKMIKRHYETRREFDWSPARPVIFKYAEDMFNTVRETPREVRKVLESFVPRQIEQLYRLSMHYCCIRRDTTIKPEDVRHGARLVLKSFHMIVNWLEENPEMRGGEERGENAKKKFRGLLEVVSNHDANQAGFYGVNSIIDDLSMRWNLSQSSCYKWINRFEDKNWVVVERRSGSKFIKPRGQE